MKMLTISCVLTALAFTTACSDKAATETPESKPSVTIVESYTSSIQVTDLEGDWKAGTGVGKIERSDGSNLFVTTETGLKGDGKVNGDQIEVPSWHVTGKLTVDKKKILWSNSFVWTR